MRHQVIIKKKSLRYLGNQVGYETGKNGHFILH